MNIRPALQGGEKAHSPEDQLASRLRAGDPKALEELLDLHWSRLVGYAEPFTGSIDDAEEVVQRAFVRIWRRRERITAGRSVRGLLYRTVRNLTIDMQRKRQTRRDFRARLGQRRPRPRTPFERLQERELQGAIEKAIGELSPRRREAFTLCRMHGLTHREASEVLRLSPQTVSNHVTAALRSIREALAPRLG